MKATVHRTINLTLAENKNVDDLMKKAKVTLVGIFREGLRREKIKYERFLQKSSGNTGGNKYPDA